jgi:hypothetical protein
MSPGLTIEFNAGKFRNRTIHLNPYKIAGPDQVRTRRVKGPLVLNGKEPDKAWQSAPRSALLPLIQEEGLRTPGSDEVQFLADADWIYVRTVLTDPCGKVAIPAPDPCAEGSRLVLLDEHVRVRLTDGNMTRTYAVSPESLRYYTCNEKEDSTRDWRAVVGRCHRGWCVQLALPRKVYADSRKVRVNVMHRRELRGKKSGRRYVELELCPSYHMGSNPDLLPDWQAQDRGTDGAELIITKGS